MKRIPSFLFAAALVLLTLQPASASEGDEGSGYAAFDQAFAEYIVGPIATVLFWDLMFWDNTLSEGTGIGSKVDGGVVTAFEDGTYTVRYANVTGATSGYMHISGDTAAQVCGKSLHLICVEQ